MLSLSKKTDYALMALCYLARTDGGRVVRTREIAERLAIPGELLAKILQKLVRAGLLASAPGPTGGYVLARPASEISVGAVVDAIDGLPALAHCMKTVQNDCEQQGSCTIKGPLTVVNERLFRLLNEISVREISSPYDVGLHEIAVR